MTVQDLQQLNPQVRRRYPVQPQLMDEKPPGLFNSLKSNPGLGLATGIGLLGTLLAAKGPHQVPGQARRIWSQGLAGVGQTLLDYQRAKQLEKYRGDWLELQKQKLDEPKEPRTIRGADGYHYYVGSGEPPRRVLPGIEKLDEPKEPRTIRGADGYHYYVGSGEPPRRVLPGIEKPPSQLTQAQMTENARIKAARDFLDSTGFTPEQVKAAMIEVDPLSFQKNPDYIPHMMSLVSLSMKRMHGDDPDHQQRLAWGTGLSPEPAPPVSLPVPQPGAQVDLSSQDTGAGQPMQYIPNPLFPGGFSPVRAPLPAHEPGFLPAPQPSAQGDLFSQNIAAGPKGTGTLDDPIRVTTQQELDAVEPGQHVLLPSGETFRKAP